MGNMQNRYEDLCVTENMVTDMAHGVEGFV